MKNTKWLATAASIWIQCTCGATFAFGIYSAALKSSQGYDQSTLDVVSVFKDIGANIGVLSGLLYHAVTKNHNNNSQRCGFGLSTVYIVGAVHCFVGYILMWLSVIGVIYRPHVVFMCLFMFLAAQAHTFFNTANIVVALRNFPDYGGTTVGIMKGFFGLSGAILIQIYLTLFDGNSANFLLMSALFPPFMCLIFMSFVHIDPSKTTNDQRHLNNFSLIALAIAAYLVTIIILQNIFVFPSWAHILTTVVLLILLSTPLQVALKAQKNEQSSQSPTTTPLILPSEAKEFESERNDMNLLQAMSTINFWLLLVAMVCAMGSGLATNNNISQVGESLGYSTIEINTLVSLWSIWNILGRIGVGYFSDMFLHKHGCGRPLFVSLTQATMVLGHLIIGSGGNLYIGTLIVGICNGAQWSLMPTICSEIFGVTHMGTIFNTIGAANPIGSYIFSVLIIGSIYDKQVETKGGGSCIGVHCFMLSFFVFAGVCLFGCLVSLVLFFRTRRFYALILQKRMM
ncbi:protein NUCLEAR FUSION DEFECTIVE 4-like [Rutidosis leptorrhynchoides]|uniref:protein NUCLEAR FUSION DEFECTIVE 4-like n=1 Tax=Rutidosis leptorrhynchoides TaxID=125765 RepID=UPI003A999B1A